MDNWFPRLSPNAVHVACGSEVVSVDGHIVGPGVQPVWLSDSEILYRDREDVRLHRYNIVTGFTSTIDLPSGCNLLDAQNGRWAGWFAGYRPTRVRTSDNREYIDAYGPAISPTGDVAYTDGSGRMYINGTLMPDAADARCPRWTEAGLAWIEERVPHQPRVSSLGWANAINRAHLVVPVHTPLGRHLVVLEDARLICYLAGSYYGWVVAEGDTFNPDAVWSESQGRIRVVWRASDGSLISRHVTLSDLPMVDLREAPPPVPVPPPAPSLNPPGIDVTEYGSIIHPDLPWEISWSDRNNPGFSGSVYLDRGSVHVSLTNPAGSDRTGRRRPVEVVCPDVGPPPVDPPGSDVGQPVPPPSDVDQWRGNFLAFPGYPYAFMYPSWDYGKRARFRTAYREAGLTHLPFGIWGAYGGQGLYDFRADPSAFRFILGELKLDGLVPCVFVHTDAITGRGPMTRDALENWAGVYLPQIADAVPLWCTGWEFNQIDQAWGGYWTGDGREHLAWARTLRSILGPSATIYAHFSPERITGYPNYPAHDGPQDEASWWKDSNPLDGLLYQRRPDEPEPDVLVHTLGGVSADGSTDVGDASRIAGGYWGIYKKFVFFEHSRDSARWKRLTGVVSGDPRVSGFC